MTQQVFAHLSSYIFAIEPVIDVNLIPSVPYSPESKSLAWTCKTEVPGPEFSAIEATYTDFENMGCF